MQSNPTTVKALFIATIAIASVGAAALNPQRDDAIRRVEVIATDSPEVNRATGVIRHARFQPGTVVGDGFTVAEKTELFLVRHGRAFGIDAPGVELEASREQVDRLGHTHLVFRQVYKGIPVFGARMGLHFDDSSQLVAVSASVVPSPEVRSVLPEVSEDRGRDWARTIVAKQHLMDPVRLTIDSAELVVFDDGVIWGRDGRAHLSWHIQVTDNETVLEHLFIDAVDGQLIEQITGTEDLERLVYEHTSSNVVWQEGDSLPYSGSGPLRDQEINNLITVAEQTHTTFANLSGGTYFSYTGNDGAMRSYYDRNGMDCPNAYFNGSSTSFCVGTAVDDIIAHEWAHGYTSETHGLVYQWQSGALNESYSDIFGEVVDLLYDDGTDSPSTPRAPETCSASTGIDHPELLIVEPAPLVGTMNIRSASFNPAPPWTVTAMVEAADDGIGRGNDACEPLVDFTPGTIALITMANCEERFVTPVTNAIDAGAIGAIVVNPLNDAVTTMSGPGRLSIPSVFLGRSDGDILRGALDEGLVVTLQSSGDGSLRWLIGEDSSAFGGAIRDMWRPECLTDPGSVFSDRFYCGSGDNGGVHINSGVPNHAFAMLVDGGSANGIDVPSIGMTRAAHIYWRAMTTYQVPLSDFRDHADALTASCHDLLGRPLPDLLTGQVSIDVITEDHCSAVDTAMEATQMRSWPSQCNFDTILDPNVPTRPTNAFNVFLESFDTEPVGWVLTNQGVYSEYEPRDWIWTQDVPEGGDGGAFYAADSPMVGNCQAGSDDQSGVVHLESPVITLPTANRHVLFFDHYVATEARFDGGNLKISVNGGPYELVGSNAFIFNPYNDELHVSSRSENPLAGEEAFAGTNETTYRGSWGQSQVDLSGHAAAGDSIVLRFDFGTDGCSGRDGWYIDNVRVAIESRERQGGSRVIPSP